VTFTVTVLTAVFVDTQPNALVPVTLKLVVVNGLTIDVPDEYVYVDAPLGLNVNVSPVQITPEFTLTVGVIFTVTVLIA
jgi:hypothetical protein